MNFTIGDTVGLRKEYTSAYTNGKKVIHTGYIVFNLSISYEPKIQIISTAKEHFPSTWKGIRDLSKKKTRSIDFLSYRHFKHKRILLIEK